MYHKELFKKFLKNTIITLTLLSPLTLTAGCVKFNNSNVTNPNIPKESVVMESITDNTSVIIDSTTYDEGLASTIATIIDSTEDLTNEEQTTALTEALNQIDGFVAATLVRVVDGDTIVVNIKGNDFKVRLIGIDTPESVASQEYLDRTGKFNTEEGVIASEYTKTILENTHTVYLQTDISNTDRYGRLLRYVWLEIPEDYTDTYEIATKMLNGILVADHIAEVTPYKPDLAYNEDFEYIYDNYEEFDRD